RFSQQKSPGNPRLFCWSIAGSVLRDNRGSPIEPIAKTAKHDIRFRIKLDGFERVTDVGTGYNAGHGLRIEIIVAIFKAKYPVVCEPILDAPADIKSIGPRGGMLDQRINSATRG